MKKRLVYSVLLSFLCPLVSSGQTNRYFTLNNVKSRPLAMGGAFTAVEDDLASVGFNPAAYFSSYDLESTNRLYFFLNPVAPFVGGFNHDDLFEDGDGRLNDILLSLSLMLKSMSVRINRLQIGVVLGEESLAVPVAFHHDSVFGLSGYRQNHSHSIIGRFKLADRVSLGGTANFMFGSMPNNPVERFSELGFSYGILLKPEEGLNIGVSFVSLPDSLKNHRMPLERFVDESVNLGISYELFTKTLFSLDVRNLGEEETDAIREFHFGVEQVFLSQLALRAGYFKKNKNEHVFSCGLGILNGDRLFKRNQDKTHRNFYLNYAFVYEKSPPLDNRWHFLSLMIKI